MATPIGVALLPLKSHANQRGLEGGGTRWSACPSTWGHADQRGLSLEGATLIGVAKTWGYANRVSPFQEEPRQLAWL